MKKKFAFAALSFVSVAVLAACGSAPAGSSSEGTEIGDTIKIGLDMELSGNVAQYGIAEKNGIELAVEEINANGGVDGKELEIVTKDNKSDNTEAATIATSLTTEEKVNVILGPATSGAIQAATTAVNEAAVPLLTPSGTADSLTVQDNGDVQEYIFRTTFQDSFQGQVIAQYVTDNMKSDKVVLYYDNASDYAKGISDKFKEEFTGTIVAEDTFASGDKDFQAAITKFKKEDFDAFVVIGYYNEAGLIIKQAREAGIDATILGPDGFNDSQLAEIAGASNATDVYFTSGYSTEVSLSDKADSFVKAYNDKFSEKPNMFAALGYDSVYMVAEAAKGASTSIELKDNLAKLADFDGVTGNMTIDEQHNPVKSAIMIGLKDGKEDSAVEVEVK